MKDILAKSILNKIERLEAFEERLNVRLENISVKTDNDGWVFVLFELHSNNGNTLEKDIDIECVAYDIDGQILEVEGRGAYKNSFFGFEVFKLSFQENGIAEKINKLRLYPKL